MMKLPWFKITILWCFALLLEACGQAGVLALADETQSPPAPLPANAMQTGSEMNDAQMTQSAPSSTMESLIKKAKEDLALHLSTAVTEISLVEARNVTWLDASLGCPKGGDPFMQVITDGYLILFKVNGTTYEYHTDTGEQVILCEYPEFPIIPVKPGEIDDGQPWMPN